jgi:hypothetical protein
MPAAAVRTSPSSARARLRRFVRDTRGTLLGVLAFVAFGLGWWGFTDAGHPKDVEHFWQAPYRALQIFTFHAGEQAQGNWQLEVARWLAPLSLGLVTVVAAFALVGEQRRLLGLRFRRKHVVIAGLGVKGFKLAQEFDEAGEYVVVIEQDENNKSIAGCRERHIPVVKGDATDESVLRKAGVLNARNLVVTCGEDNTNLQVSFTARLLVETRSRGVLTTSAHLDDLGLWRRLHGLAAGTRTFRLEFFNVAETGARMLLEKHSPFEPTGSRPIVVIVGYSPLGEHLLLHMARTWRDRENGSGDALRIGLLGPTASRDVRFLLGRYPELQGICNLEALQVDTAPPEFEHAVSLPSADGESSALVAYVCMESETEGLDLALALSEQLGAREGRIVLVVDDEAVGVATAVRSAPTGLRQVEVFGTLSNALTRDLILRGVTENLARATHERYLLTERKKGLSPRENESLAQWDLLPESLRESNRRFADGIGAQLEAAGCVPVPSPLAAVDGNLFRFSEEEVERLAEMEHERWCRDLLADGWRPTQGEKDPEHKRHPMLVPWSDLSEHDRDKDRELVRAMPETLGGAGFEIHRVGHPRWTDGSGAHSGA